jgi:hypothetical protein
VQDGRAGSLERGFSDADIEEVYRAEKDGTLPDNVGQAVKGLRAAKLFPPAHCIVQIEVLRGPSYHWWADAVFSMVALVAVVLLWVAFFAVCWIVRGFART